MSKKKKKKVKRKSKTSSISIILDELRSYLRSKKDKIGFFDLETQYLFRELEPKWESMTSKSKQKMRASLIPKMKVSVAGILKLDKKKSDLAYRYYEEDEVEQLEEDLLKLDKIVGHNLLRFDYLVLVDYFSNYAFNKLKDKTIDTFKLIKDETRVWTRLEDLGKLNFGVAKPVDTLKIPKMWRDGHHKEVKSYLKMDLNMTAALFLSGVTSKSISYHLKDQGNIAGTRSKTFDWTHLVE